MVVNCRNAPGAGQELSEAFFGRDMLWVRHDALVELMRDLSDLLDFAGDRDTIPLL